MSATHGARDRLRAQPRRSEDRPRARRRLSRLHALIIARQCQALPSSLCRSASFSEFGPEAPSLMCAKRTFNRPSALCGRRYVCSAEPGDCSSVPDLKGPRSYPPLFRRYCLGASQVSCTRYAAACRYSLSVHPPTREATYSRPRRALSGICPAMRVTLSRKSLVVHWS